MWSPMETSPESGQAPCARCKHAAAVADGYVYVLGGRGAGGALPLKDFWRYHLESGVWERLQCGGEPPPSLQQHTMTSHGHCLYVFGGEAGALSLETPLWILDTKTLIWRKLPGHVSHPSNRRKAPTGRGQGGAGAGPRGRRGHSAHALNDCLLIYGGYMDLKGSTNELWAFHYESASWQLVRTAARGVAGPARHRHAAALAGDALYVHGGLCDLRDSAELWTYHTLSRAWSLLRTPAKLAPPARSGHAALRAGGHFYIFGGEVAGHPVNDLWRFHFATETWERVQQTLQWPSPRVDACALLLSRRPRGSREPPAPPPGRDPRPDRPTSLLHEISRLSAFNMRRNNRCSYSMLAPDQDSTESLVRPEPVAPMSKSQSAYIIDRQPIRSESPREADLPEPGRELAREPISVPDFADMVLPTPVLTPAQAAKLVYLDSEEEEEMRAARREACVVVLPKSASVRFTREDDELCTSDYCSAEAVGRLGFSNPHYDPRGAALTPDSGLAAADIPLRPLAPPARAPAPAPAAPAPAPAPALLALLLGGKEGAHVARLQAPLSLWTYRLL